MNSLTVVIGIDVTINILEMEDEKIPIHLYLVKSEETIP